MEIKVWKFGGSFLKGSIMLSFREIIFKEAKNGNQILFVVSAIEGITRLLRLIFEAKTEKLNEDFKDLVVRLSLDEFRRIHVELILNLFSSEKAKKAKTDFLTTFHDLGDYINFYEKGDNEEAFYASVLKFGELASSGIFSSYLDCLGVSKLLFDARGYVVTSDSFKNAEIKSIDPLLEELFLLKYECLVTQGFIGKNLKGEDTVLGFDGSDLSAAYLAGLLKDNGRNVSLTYWKNVSGFYKKDPSIYLNEEVFRYKMKFDEYALLPSHPIRLDAVRHAIEKGITVRMANFLVSNGIHAKICP